jgi:hypothetical protein
MNRTNRRRSLARRCGKPKLHRLGLVLTVALWSALAVADDPGSSGVSAAAQEKIAQLIQYALGPYRADAESGSGATNSATQHLLSVEANFR